MAIISIILMALATQPSDVEHDTSPPTIPEEIRTALENNAKIFSNIYISGARGQRMLESAGTVLKTFGSPESEADFTQRIQFELRFQDAKYRESLRYPPGRYHSGNDIQENSFDGTKFFKGRYDPLNERAPGSLIITTPALSGAERKLRKTISSWVYCDLWYLIEAGFKGPTQEAEMGRRVRSLVLARADAGEVISVKRVGQNAEQLLEIVIEYPEPWQSNMPDPIETDPTLISFMDGTDQLQMRIERQRRELVGKRRLCRFLLDGRMGYSVRERWESRKESGSLMFHTRNSDFVQIETGGAWLPKRCDVKCYAYLISPLYTSPKPLYETFIQVEKLELRQFGQNELSLWYGAPGLIVQDYTHPRSTVLNPHIYTVTSSMDDLSNRLGNPSYLSRGALIILINVIMIFIILLVIYIRSRRKG